MYLGTVNNAGFAALLKGVFNEGDLTQPDIKYFKVQFFDRKSAEFVVASDAISVPSFQLNFPYDAIGFTLRVLAALSAKLEIGLYDENNVPKLIKNLEQGRLKSSKFEDSYTTCQKLRVTFELDEFIWGSDFSFNEDFIIQELREFAFLAPATRFEFLYPKFGEHCRTIFQFPKGLEDYLEYLALDGLGSTRLRTAFNFVTDDFALDVAFGVRQYLVDRAILKSYANYHYTHEEGTHLKALFQGISVGLELYLEKYTVFGDYNLAEEKLRETLVGSISIVLKSATWEGATKNKLSNEEIIVPIVRKVAQHFLISLENDKAAAEDYLRYQVQRKK